MKFTKIILAVFISLLAFAPIASANDYFSNQRKNNFEHRLYFSLPLQKFKNSQPVKYGYTFNMKHSIFNRERLHHKTDYRAALVDIQFSPDEFNKINLIGLPMLKFDRTGLYYGQDENTGESGGSGNTILIGLGALVLVGAAVATSGGDDDTAPICDTVLGILERDCWTTVEE